MGHVGCEAITRRALMDPRQEAHGVKVEGCDVNIRILGHFFGVAGGLGLAPSGGFVLLLQQVLPEHCKGVVPIGDMAQGVIEVSCLCGGEGSAIINVLLQIICRLIMINILIHIDPLCLQPLIIRVLSDLRFNIIPPLLPPSRSTACCCGIDGFKLWDVRIGVIIIIIIIIII